MVNYKKGKIYRIVDTQNETVYIGSTCQSLSQRFTRHKHKGNGNKIVLVEDCPCENREQLFMREQAVIEEHDGLLNIFRAYISPEQQKEKCREYRENNKEKISEYYENNKEKINERCREYNEKNKEKISKQRREYYNANKDKKSVKVVCEHCGCEVRTDSLKRHQRTKKCLAQQNN